MPSYKTSTKRRRINARKALNRDATSSPRSMRLNSDSRKRPAGSISPSAGRSMGVHPPLAPAPSMGDEDEDALLFDEVEIERLTPTSNYRRAMAAGQNYRSDGYQDEYNDYTATNVVPYGTSGQQEPFPTGWPDIYQGNWNTVGGQQDTAYGSNKRVEKRRKRSKRDGFGWREREWGSRLWVQRFRLIPGLAVTLILVVIVSLFAFVIATKAANKASLPSIPVKKSTVNPIIIEQGGGASSPTPNLPAYTVGVWVSNMSPAVSGTIQVFVRVGQNSSSVVNAPMANVPLRVSATDGSVSGPSKTDTNGLATFTLTYSASPGSPVYVTATALINGRSISSETVFVAG